MTTTLDQPVALVTGSAKRIGAEIVKHLHQKDYRVVIHHHSSEKEALALCDILNTSRQDSAIAVQGNLLDIEKCKAVAEVARNQWQRIDLLVNNASTFYPTPITEATEQQWDDLIGTNLKAPFFLSQQLVPHLKETNGNIINIVDIYAKSPLIGHPIYSIAKAGNVMLTKSLAKELAPDIRVNGIAPGNILWPNKNETATSEEKKDAIKKIAMQRQGSLNDITQAVIYLADAPYITGQIITVDGGRSI